MNNQWMSNVSECYLLFYYHYHHYKAHIGSCSLDLYWWKLSNAIMSAKEAYWERICSVITYLLTVFRMVAIPLTDFYCFFLFKFSGQERVEAITYQGNPLLYHLLSGLKRPLFQNTRFFLWQQPFCWDAQNFPFLYSKCTITTALGIMVF